MKKAATLFIILMLITLVGCKKAEDETLDYKEIWEDAKQVVDDLRDANADSDDIRDARDDEEEAEDDYKDAEKDEEELEDKVDELRAKLIIVYEQCAKQDKEERDHGPSVF